MPETSVHVLDKNREISPLEREEGYGGKVLEKVVRRCWYVTRGFKSSRQECQAKEQQRKEPDSWIEHGGADIELQFSNKAEDRQRQSFAALSCFWQRVPDRRC